MRFFFVWQAARETRGQEAARLPPNLSHEDKICKLADMGFLPQQVVSVVERERERASVRASESMDGCASVCAGVRCPVKMCSNVHARMR